MIEHIDNLESLTPWELSELESLIGTQPFEGPVTLYHWERQQEAQEHIVEYGDMTAEDYRARDAAAMAWMGRIAA